MKPKKLTFYRLGKPALENDDSTCMSAAKQRQVLCHAGTTGTGARPGMAGQGRECTESALAKEKFRQEKPSGEWFAERSFIASLCVNGSWWLGNIGTIIPNTETILEQSKSC
jgi:hypothetical protein